eukprot:c20159_g1_i1 orf=345-2096(-)
MVDSKAGLLPAAVQRQGNTPGLGVGSLSSVNNYMGVKDSHVKGERKHQFRHEHLNAEASPTSSTDGAMVGATSSNTFRVSASKDVAKKFKEKEMEPPNRNIVDLTGDSPQNDGTRLACASDSVSPELSFLRRHHRTSQTHRLPNQSHLHQVPSEADISLSGSGSRQRLEPNRGGFNLKTFSPPVEISNDHIFNQKSEVQRRTNDMLKGAHLNASLSGASSGGRKDSSRILPKSDDKLAVPIELNDKKGKSSVTSSVDGQASGHLSEPDRLLLWKRKRSPVMDAAKSRQRFRPPRTVSGSSTSSPSVGGMQRPIEVDSLEYPRSSGVENNLVTPERARQIEEDEMLAKFLQEDYGSEAGGGSSYLGDEQLARMLQEEEDAKNMQQRAESTSQTINASTMRAARREMQRVLAPAVRSPAARPTASSSRMRLLRNLHNRSSQHMIRGRRLGGRTMNASDSLLHFPEGLGLEARVEFLAAMETAAQENFPLFDQVDRDFNEDDYEMLLALDDTNHAHSGASRYKIDQLPVSVIKPTDVYEETCSICLETPVVDDMVRRLPCMHGFHLQCIDEWLERQANCPICKMEL